MDFWISEWISADSVRDFFRDGPLGKTTIPRAPSYVITHYHYVRVTENYMETMHVKKMADLP